MIFLIANELTVPVLLWRALWRRPTLVLEQRSILQGHEGLVGRLVNWLRACDRIKTLSDMPNLEKFRDAGDFQRLTNVFAECEDWLEQKFDFAGTDQQFGRYGLAVRHIICNEAYRRYNRGYLMDEALRSGGVEGYDDFDAQFLEQRFLRSVSRKRLSIFCRPVLNALMSALAMTATITWVLSRIRLRVAPPETPFIASDYVGDIRDILLWNEVTTDPDQVLVVFRSRAYRKNSGAEIANWPSCLPTDGVFNPAQGLAALGLALGDGARLFFKGYNLPPDFLRPLLALPWKRLVYRALFNKVRPSFYWGRDDYNVDHVMRNQELRRVGGVSVTRMHGLPSIVPYAHQYRHLDFDLYYMQGTGPYESYYKHKWPTTMRVRPVGSFGLTREELISLGDDCPKDIAFILGPSFHEDAILVAVEEIAHAFPDRTIWINTKAPYRDRGAFGLKFQRLAAEGPSNIKEFRGRTYELFFMAYYWLSESSTLIAEAIQFGRVGLCLDPDTRIKFLYYRKFPDLIVGSGKEAVERILGIEDGSQVYCRDNFAPIISLEGNICWDLVRKDMGLKPLRHTPLPHLAFVGAASPQPAAPLLPEAAAPSAVETS